MLARLGRSDGALPTPGSKREVVYHQNRSGQPSETEDTTKASRNWFGGIVSFLAKKSLPTTSRNWLTNTGARRENAVCLISQVQNGPAEPSLFAHRITCFRSHSRLCWDLLSVLELPGCARRRACAHLLGKRNSHYSELRWGNPIRVKSHFVHLRWRRDFENEREVRETAGDIIADLRATSSGIRRRVSVKNRANRSWRRLDQEGTEAAAIRSHSPKPTYVISPHRKQTCLLGFSACQALL